MAQLRQELQTRRQEHFKNLSVKSGEDILDKNGKSRPLTPTLERSGSGDGIKFSGDDLANKMKIKEEMDSSVSSEYKRVLAELITTERDYVADLQFIQQVSYACINSIFPFFFKKKKDVYQASQTECWSCAG